MLILTREIMFEVNKPIKTGHHGSRGGKGIYLTSKPYEWIVAMSDQGINIGEYIYEVLVLNPEKAKEYLQVVGGGFGELPETVINSDEGIILGLWKDNDKL